MPFEPFDDSMVEQIRAIADAWNVAEHGRQTDREMDRAPHHRKIRMSQNPEWPASAHYEFLARGPGVIGVELHVENEGHYACLFPVLQSLRGQLHAAGFPYISADHWQYGWRLGFVLPFAVGVPRIVETMRELIARTYGTFTEEALCHGLRGYAR